MFDEDATSRELVGTAIAERSCADLNLVDAIAKLGLEAEQVLMVGVTANEVGFGDQLENYEAEGKVKQNYYGWREIPGFNAFFARTSEVPALGRRLADCADINFEFKDADGNTVIGFEHGTRTDMFGIEEFPFDRNNEKVSFTEYALGQAIDRYAPDPASIRIRLSAAIKGHNFIKRFDSREKMEEHLPGWLADGFVKNISNLGWKEGDPIPETDVWQADTRELITRDIRETMIKFAIPEGNFDTEGIIDPGDSEGVHSSHEYREQYGDSRDLYITFVPKDGK